MGIEWFKKSAEEISFDPHDAELIDPTESIVQPTSVSKQIAGNIPIPAVFPPFSIEAYIDTGLYKLMGVGTHSINFSRSFSNNPMVVATVLGYWSILRIKVPMPGFLMSISKTGFKIFTLGGTYYVSFIAIGR